MTKTFSKLVIGFVFTFFFGSSLVLAKNTQTVVLGFGIGSYNFDDEDIKDVENIIYGSEFIEWYLFDEIGLGIRTHKFYKTDSADSDEELLMGNLNLTVNWVFLGSEDDFRMAIYAGYGPGAVEYSNEKANLEVSETATTSSGGLFLDWGSETFGIRLGAHVVSASFDYEEDSASGTIDGSGSSVDLGVRLAF